MTFTRDSALWWIVAISGAATFCIEHFALLQAAIPGLGPRAHAWIELLSATATAAALYLRMSPLRLSPSSELHGEHADPDKTLTMIGRIPNGKTTVK